MKLKHFMNYEKVIIKKTIYYHRITTLDNSEM